MKTEEKTQVSEVGFEPGTFRSCVAHSIRYATETPPIPDVLLVLVAPKYINRNVTTTLQSRFTPTQPHRPHTRALLLLFFYFYFIFYIFFYFFYFIFVKLLNTSHCSPKFGLYRFFNSFSSKSLSFNMADLGGKWFFFHRNPYLLTWRIWGGTLTPPILLMSSSVYVWVVYDDG